jgi:hypothetical protein
MAQVSWDEAFAEGYEEWPAGMTADVGFYAGLAREAGGPLVEFAIGNGRVDVAGLELEALYGGFAGEPFADDSTEYVFIARRPLAGRTPGAGGS